MGCAPAEFDLVGDTAEPFSDLEERESTQTEIASAERSGSSRCDDALESLEEAYDHGWNAMISSYLSYYYTDEGEDAFLYCYDVLEDTLDAIKIAKLAVDDPTYAITVFGLAAELATYESNIETTCWNLGFQLGTFCIDVNTGPSTDSWAWCADYVEEYGGCDDDYEEDAIEEAWNANDAAADAAADAWYCGFGL